MRYLHNYKGTTLTLRADRFSFSFGFLFFESLHPEGWYTTKLGDTSHRHVSTPCSPKAHHHTQDRPEQVKQEKHDLHHCCIWTDAAYTYTHTWTDCNWSQGGTRSSINLSTAEICEHRRLRGGQWCRLHQGGHLGSLMLSYVPAAGRGEASTYKMVVNLH